MQMPTLSTYHAGLLRQRTDSASRASGNSAKIAAVFPRAPVKLPPRSLPSPPPGRQGPHHRAAGARWGKILHDRENTTISARRPGGHLPRHVSATWPPVPGPAGRLASSRGLPKGHRATGARPTATKSLLRNLRQAPVPNQLAGCVLYRWRPRKVTLPPWSRGQTFRAGHTSCLARSTLQGRQQLVEALPGIAEKHQALRIVIELVVHARKAGVQAPLQDHHRPGAIDFEDRHSV
jgi:hypothetical protein